MSAPFTPGARVTAYLRDSGGDSQEFSIPQQEAKLAEYCRLNGLLLTRLFKDTASGTKVSGRSQFLEMVAYLAGDVPELGVLIWEYSRLARQYDDFQYYIADLRRRGYAVYSITDPVPEGLEGRLLESVIAWKNAAFSRDLARNVKRGLYYIVTTHHCYPQRQLPRGYRRQEVDLGKRRDGTPHIASRLVPDEATALLVNLAFRMRARGSSHLEIHRATGLYKRHYSYGRMLRNPIYIGRFTFGEVTVDDFCQPLVDRPTWDVVQAIETDSRQRFGQYHPRRVSSPYLLSGLVRCGMCGFSVNGHTCIRKDGSPSYYYYCCDHHTGIRTCRNLPVSRNRLEQGILLAIRNALTPEKVLAIYEEANRQLAAGSDETRLLVERKHADLADMSGRIRRITAAIAELGHSTALLNDLVALEEQQRQAQADLATLEGQALPAPDSLTLAQVTVEIDSITETLNGEDFRARQLMLRSLVTEIRYTRPEKADRTPHGTIAFAAYPLTIPF